jgi:hypothetical protein
MMVVVRHVDWDRDILFQYRPIDILVSLSSDLVDLIARNGLLEEGGEGVP